MACPIGDPLDRILKRMVVAENGCWLWTGRVDKDGYSTIWTKGTNNRGHRVVFERVHGKAIPAGLVIDHLCKTRNCLNPKHMEAVTSAENVARGAVCRCGTCARCLRNSYMRDWYARRKVAA